MLYLLISSTLILFQVAQASNIIMSIENMVYVGTVGNSGKITVGPTASDVDLFFEVKKIEEKDVDGNKINDNMHFVNTLANVPCENDTDEPNTDDTYGVNRTVISRSCALPNDAYLSYELSIMNEEGNFVNGNETTPVIKGDVKFTLTFTHWNFSTSGQSLDVDVIVKHPSKTETNQISQRQSEMSDGKKVFYSAYIGKDGTDVELENDNPSAIVNGFRVSFPRFDSIAVYDPVIRGYNTPVPGGGDTDLSNDSKTTYIIIGAVGGFVLIVLVTYGTYKFYYRNKYKSLT